ASLAIDQKKDVQNVPVASIRKVQTEDPLADGSIPEILVDNADAQAVRVTGDWKLMKGGYGKDYLADTTHSATASVMYTPKISRKASYQVYSYVTHSAKISRKTDYEIDLNGKKTHKPVDFSDMKVVGQTSGEWVNLGELALSPADKLSITISNKDASGFTIADALLLVPVKQ
ncbi:MAG: xanthan lyase, partial [Mucilaginibacter polytrichastri]|nr:xanthan lyase [Mucilaginibacter polytrichastri]